MKVLFDSNTPAPLATFLKNHEVTRAGQLGWQSLENGELLTKAEDEGFDVVVSCDQNLQYQQNFADRKIALVVLSSNDWSILRPVSARIATKVDFTQRGQVMYVDISKL